LEGYNVECFEDPVTQERAEWNRQIREKTIIPVALHSSRVLDILRHIRAEAVDYVNVGGSLETVFRAAHLTESAGIPIWIQIEGHCYDIQAAFNAHLNAVIPNATLPQDTLPFLREDTIVTEPLWPDDGFVKVPEKPGLGIELDEKKIRRYRVA
jgi:L-alanine-DL-glutamate epimerase-like enolase superfamily enzyme